MQKVILLFASFLLFFIYVFHSYAQTPKTNDKLTPTPIEQKKIDYSLPYPGILPDHPLYKLKVLRDKITERLISDPHKKAEFYLLQTDKGIVSADFLVDKKNVELAKNTALKAENNYTEITFLYKATETKPNKNQYEKLVRASKKHQEILQGILKKIDEKDQAVFKQVSDFSKTNLNEITLIYKD